jgi:hypothetical protein
MRSAPICALFLICVLSQESDMLSKLFALAALAMLATTFEAGAACTAANVTAHSDLNGDGKADIVWRNTTTGMVTTWLMNGTTMSSNGTLLAAGNGAWTVAGIGDLNGDGKADIVWRNASTGQVTGWLMRPTSCGATPAQAKSPAGS